MPLSALSPFMFTLMTLNNMEEEIAQLREQIASLERRFHEHQHLGPDAPQIKNVNIVGTIKVVTVSANLTAILAGKPRTFFDQILIDTTTSTKKLYVYDSVGNAWRSCTIA